MHYDWFGQIANWCMANDYIIAQADACALRRLFYFWRNLTPMHSPCGWWYFSLPFHNAVLQF